MAGKNTAVFGIYPTYEAVERAVDALRVAGFRNTDISVLFPENVGTKDFAHEKGTKAPEGAATGAGTGAVVGGTRRLARGHRRVGDSGTRPVHRGRARSWRRWPAWASAVPSAGVTGALVGMGIPEYEAKRYEGRVTKGGILLSVHSDDSEWTKRAKDILERTGAEDVSSTGETKGDFENTDRPRTRAGVP